MSLWYTEEKTMPDQAGLFYPWFNCTGKNIVGRQLVTMVEKKISSYQGTAIKSIVHKSEPKKKS